VHFFDVDPLIFIGSSAQFQKHTILETRVYSSCTCVIWIMLHSSEALHNPRSILSLKPVFTVHEFFWVGPSYCNQKFCTICLDTSVHSSQFMHLFHLNYFILIRNSTQYLKDTFFRSQWLQFAHLFDLDHLILIRSLKQSQKHTLLDVIFLSPDVMPCIPAHLFLFFHTFACVQW
jgi:hypothetical protein